jgi:hypothetical protein
MGHNRQHHHLTLVPTPDRRNHFARAGLRRAIARRFASGELAICAGAAARLFELPPPICERLLDELVSTGQLVRSIAGAYACPGRPSGSAVVGQGR